MSGSLRTRHTRPKKVEELRVSITELKEKEKTAEQTVAAGRAAYKAGDYGKALMLLRSLAEEGNAEAQEEAQAFIKEML